MQKLSLSSFYFLHLFACIIALNFSNIRAEKMYQNMSVAKEEEISFDLQEIKEIIRQSPDTLTFEKQQLLAIIANIEQQCNQNPSAEDLAMVINLPSFKKVAEISLKLTLAIIFWQRFHPWLKNKYPKNETIVELPKLIAAAFVIDSLKDFFKEVKNSFESTVSTVYDIIVS